MSVTADVREAPVGRVVSLSADLFNGPDPVPGIEVELPLEQVKASTIGAKVALVAPADLAALCDEVDALRAAHDWYRDRHNAAAAALAAKDAENARLREAVALHRPDEAEVGWRLCRECARLYPCPTVRAAGLDGEERE